jgi:two-component system LytT family response regulator
MSKIKAVIVDDEALSRDVVREFLKKHPSVEIIAEGTNGIEAVNLVSELNPDLLFLDIQMPELNGFDVLKELDSAVLPLIVFTTAHDRYALKAFEASAIDYLLKPFDQERFDKAIERVIKFIPGTDKNYRETERIKILNQYAAISDQANGHPSFIERLLVRENKKIILIQVRDVQVFEADSDYVRLHTEGTKKHLINNSLTSLEVLLNPNQFVRIHKSTIIRIDAIAEMHPHFNGEFKIFMKNGAEVKLSRSYKKALQKISGASF